MSSFFSFEHFHFFFTGAISFNVLFYQLTNMFIESFQQSLAKPNKVRMCSFSSHSWSTSVLHYVLRPCNKKGTASIWERLFFWYHSEEEKNVGQTWSLEKKRKLNFCVCRYFFFLVNLAIWWNESARLDKTQITRLQSYDKIFHLRLQTITVIILEHVKKCTDIQYWIKHFDVTFDTFFKGAQVGGRTWDLFDFRLFSLTSSALDHSTTAPPTELYLSLKMRKSYANFQSWFV